MSREPLSAARFELSMTTSVEKTEIDGIGQGSVLRFTDVENIYIFNNAQAIIALEA